MNSRLFATLFLLLVPALSRAGGEVIVQVELTDGTSVKRSLIRPARIDFAMESGQASFDVEKLERLQLGPTGKFEDSISMHGLAAQLQGMCQTPSFDFHDIKAGPNTWETIARDRIKSIRAVHLGATGLFSAVILPLITLTAMEIVLGIDNIIFLAIVAGRLPRHQQPRARRLGLIGALVTRIALLATLSFILSLTTPVYTLPDLPFLHELEARQLSWRDLILLGGGAFLIAKSTFEIHKKMEGPHDDESGLKGGGTARFGLVLIEIALFDIIFSLDSVVTAVGMVESLWIMITAMVIAVGVMMFFAERISRFVMRHPTLKVLALAFLILIGVLLVIEGCGQHIDRGYIYFAMAFSVAVEMVNLRMRKAERQHQASLPAGIS